MHKLRITKLNISYINEKIMTDNTLVPHFLCLLFVTWHLPRNKMCWIWIIKFRYRQEVYYLDEMKKVNVCKMASG